MPSPIGAFVDIAARYGEVDPTNIQAEYNMGLLFVDMENYDSAKEVAVSIYAQSFPLQGLKQKLIQAGYWE